MSDGPFGLGDPRKLLGELQNKIEKIKEDAAAVEAEGLAGGGMVRAKANGKMEVLSVTIEPELLEGSDRAMLEDLVVAAVNQALKNAQSEMTERFRELTGGIPPIPGLFG